MTYYMQKTPEASSREAVDRWVYDELGQGKRRRYTGGYKDCDGRKQI